ncbi:unnamed protein product [Vitrella brassicaformis CCMP3155]|uniref:Uncharacterized protein n=1 Tax=Vitrella brassicaformis (strain CCMP3155) TaxID=1169540 RepID=A0A0G4G887_VITBC|nr:unnamed protein product [Vitrella brassicaformis CCMP3155]|eukprot:CEM25050.1 unnamed protein product [Vitrella brassicaformis CCMP3155]
MQHRLQDDPPVDSGILYDNYNGSWRSRYCSDCTGASVSSSAKDLILNHFERTHQRNRTTKYPNRYVGGRRLHARAHVCLVFVCPSGVSFTNGCLHFIFDKLFKCRRPRAMPTQHNLIGLASSRRHQDGTKATKWLTGLPLTILIIAPSDEQLESLIGKESLPISSIVHLEPLGRSDAKYAALDEHLFRALDDFITKGGKAPDTSFFVIPNCATALYSRAAARNSG